MTIKKQYDNQGSINSHYINRWFVLIEAGIGYCLKLKNQYNVENNYKPL